MTKPKPKAISIDFDHPFLTPPEFDQHNHPFSKLDLTRHLQIDHSLVVEGIELKRELWEAHWYQHGAPRMNPS